jgi:hypothetical protein
MENDTTVTSSEDTAPGAKPDKGLIESARLARKWTRELGASKKWMERFRRGALKCEKAFLDDDANAREGANDGKVNLFWSNVQVVLSAIYGRLPQAEVDRKFKDFDDDVSRVAGMILQRILNGDIAREHDDTAAAMRDGVQDRFVVGLGQVWARYDVETEEYDEPVLDPMTGQPAMDPATGKPQTQKAERIINEEAEVDYVYWDDFRYSPCRRWRDCRWVARRVYMSEARLKKRFKLTPAQLQMIPMTTRTPDENPDDDVLKATPFKQAAVWEIWDKDDNTACWFVEGCTFVLDTQPDPLELEDFFPCPQPVVATTLTKAFRPRADYAMAQDLYRSLDRINARIETLTDAIRAAGVYDKNAGSLKQLLSSNVENALVPTDNWSSFIEKGGMKGVMDWMPIEQFANALAQLQQRKAQIERDLYEVLGISDIMRGASVASETATAQQLKVQYGGARLSNLQNDQALAHRPHPRRAVHGAGHRDAEELRHRDVQHHRHCRFARCPGLAGREGGAHRVHGRRVELPHGRRAARAAEPDGGLVPAQAAAVGCRRLPRQQEHRGCARSGRAPARTASAAAAPAPAAEPEGPEGQCRCREAPGRGRPHLEGDRAHAQPGARRHRSRRPTARPPAGPARAARQRGTDAAADACARQLDADVRTYGHHCRNRCRHRLAAHAAPEARRPRAAAPARDSATRQGSGRGDADQHRDHQRQGRHGHGQDQPADDARPSGDLTCRPMPFAAPSAAVSTSW